MGTVAPDEACSRPSDPSGVGKFKGEPRRGATVPAVACAGASASVLTHSFYLRRVRVHAHDGLDERFNIRVEAGTVWHTPWEQHGVKRNQTHRHPQASHRQASGLACYNTGCGTPPLQIRGRARSGLACYNTGCGTPPLQIRGREA
ncbi:jg27826 [Pararge aegeria aegeria]|uniref:Jg27826 protein n=1 Tax=Pararge aegeria aegeria TaxID=348720 RepID=A0A8S4RFL8_9NEOP|nr:jg27826 [Pararge aegeria aegeria]